MTIHSKVNNPTEVAPQQHFSWPLALVILALGIFLGVFASSMAAATSKTEVANGPQKSIIAGDTQERAMQAEAARYTSMGLYYATGDEQPGMAAEIARYEGLGEFYGANAQRAVAAEIARYNGLGEFYGVEQNTLAWPPRPTQFHPAENMVMSLDGLAVYHQSEWGYTPIETNADGDLGLMDFFAAKNGIVVPAADNTLAWPPRPAQFHIADKAVTQLDQNALAAYHQSEWGHTPQTIKTSANDDIGLMELSTPEE